MSSWDGDHPLDDVAAYALDALDPGERPAVQAHLARCPTCRSELDAERATLACLITPEPPPATLWHRIAPHLVSPHSPAPQLTDPPALTLSANGASRPPASADPADVSRVLADPEPPFSASFPGPVDEADAPAPAGERATPFDWPTASGADQDERLPANSSAGPSWPHQQDEPDQAHMPDGRPRWLQPDHADSPDRATPSGDRSGRYHRGPGSDGRRRLALLAAAVVAAAVGGFGLGRWAGERGSDQPGLVARAEAAAADPGSTVAELSDASGQPVARVVVDGADGTDAYVLLDDLDRPAAGQTYQLWHLDSTQPVSLGVLSVAAADGAVAVHLPPGVSRLAITVEPAAGVAMPSGPVVARGSVPSR